MGNLKFMGIYSPEERICHNEGILDRLLVPDRFADLRDEVSERWGLEVEALAANGNVEGAAYNAAIIRREYCVVVAKRNVNSARSLLEEAVRKGWTSGDIGNQRRDSLNIVEQTKEENPGRASSVAGEVYRLTAADRFRFLEREKERQARLSERMKAIMEEKKKRADRKKKNSLANRAARAEDNRMRAQGMGAGQKKH